MCLAAWDEEGARGLGSPPGVGRTVRVPAPRLIGISTYRIAVFPGTNALRSGYALSYPNCRQRTD